MGDTPYSASDELILQDQIRNMTQVSTARNAVFTVHVGDLQMPGRSECSESAFASVYSYLSLGPVPTFVLAGDNDWYDCPVPSQAWERYMRYFGRFEHLWTLRLPLDTPRLANVTKFSKRPEMFAFEHGNVLFLSVTLINGFPDGTATTDTNDHTTATAEQQWNERMVANMEWIRTTLDHYFAHYPLRGVVLFGHAVRSPDIRSFFVTLSDIFQQTPVRAATPVLYLHGDGHEWQVDTRAASVLNWPSYTAVQVEQGGHAEPCVVEVAPVVDGVMVPLEAKHGLQHIFANGLFRIDRQGGNYVDMN